MQGNFQEQKAGKRRKKGIIWWLLAAPVATLAVLFIVLTFSGSDSSTSFPPSQPNSTVVGSAGPVSSLEVSPAREEQTASSPATTEVSHPSASQSQIIASDTGSVTSDDTPPAPQEQPVSEEQTPTTEEDLTPPTPTSAPSASVVVASDTSALISWDAPTSDDGSPASAYEVFISSDGANWSSVTSSAELSVLVENLAPATEFFFAVSASNDAGPSEKSDPVSIVTPPAPLSPAVVSASLEESSEPLLSFVWETAAQNAEYSTDSGVTWTAANTSPATFAVSFGSDNSFLLRTQDCFMEACTDWAVSEEVVVSVGSPVATPTAPTAATLSVAEEADSTPEITFSWTGNAALTEQEFSFDGETWTAIDATATSSSLSASFGETYTAYLRSRTCTEGNSYNDDAELCSDWSFSEPASVSVGSPLNTPVAPSPVSLASVEDPSSTPTIEWSWTLPGESTEQEISLDSGEWSQVDLSNSSSDITTAPDQSHTFAHRSRTCVSGNSYNDFETLCSDWAFSSTSVVSTGSPLVNPDAPTAASVAATEDADSTPIVTFSWNLDSAATEQELSFDSGTWISADLLVDSTSRAASFDTTYTLAQRQRTCIVGNAYNDFATLCSEWVESNMASESVGSPLVAPAPPATASIVAAEDADSTPTVTFSWSVDPAATEQELSFDSGSWMSNDIAVDSTTTNATFGQTYTLEQRQRSCVAGNAYNDFAVLCSEWVESNMASESVGSPLSAPSAPAASTVAASEDADSTPTVTFSWSVDPAATEQELSFDSGSWMSNDIAVDSTTTNATFGRSYTMSQRQRTCITGNVYNDFTTLCSEWAVSNTASESVGSPVATPAAPGTSTVSVSEQADSTPTVTFSWSVDPAATEQELSFDSGSWQSNSLSVNSTVTNASFDRTYTMDQRQRTCVPGNVYNDFATLCSNWATSNTASEYVGSPLSAPADPAAASVSGSREEDSSPRYSFSWTATSPSQLEVNTGSGFVYRYASSTGTGWLNASFGTTYTYQVRGRNCITGNAYNNGAQLCSDWVTSNTASVSIGSPLSDPSAPAAISVSGSTGDLSASFSWTSVSYTEQQRSFNGGSWTAISGTSYNVSSPAYSTTYTLAVRARDCVTGNAYNDGATLCSSWTTSTTRSITTPNAPPPPGPTVTGWSRWTSNENTELGTIPRYHVYVNFSGTAHVQFFYNSDCSGSSSNVYTNRTGSTGASTTSTSGWVYNTYNGGSALLTDPSTGGTTCSNNGW